MIKSVVGAVIFIVIAGILQSTLIARLFFFFRLRIIPDIALCILVFTAYQNGMMSGQVTGFISGIFLDFLSQAPLGLNIFVRTVTGALAGLLRGNLLLDPVFLPMALCAAATLFKAFMFFLLHFLFENAVPAYSWSAPVLWLETAANALLAPFIFDFLKKFSALLEKRRS
ncbi:MAG: rod shape-determining protein MreD [Spirochaetaceae bacterium]|nr:rod shape-determining protein MreD [Spirochaetaceae bacterium]GMO31757.1 MAG: hypothetical protein Pg6A_20730 [Termitinemataceae bacterium]